MTNYLANPDGELSFDQVESIGLDGTGRDGGERFPYTWAKLTDAERAALLIKALAEVTGSKVLGGLDAGELVCALHTLAEVELIGLDADLFDQLSERQTDVMAKVHQLWDDEAAAMWCERCNDEPITDEASGLGDNCQAGNDGRVVL